MSARPATELLPLTDRGRRYVAERTVRLGDVDPSGRLRLDAAARYLQDVASDDALAADLPNALGWVVRRTMMQVSAAPVVTERVGLTTFCTGAGRSWAERRTSIAGELGGSIDAVSLWVQIDTTTGRPARLGEEFFAVYGEAAAERTVSSKLSLPGRPSDGAASESWRFRRSDLDLFDHVNNAAQWAVVEEMVQRAGADRRLTAELEYLAPADAGADLQLTVEGGSGWLLDGTTVCSAFAWEASTSR